LIRNWRLELSQRRPHKRQLINAGKKGTRYAIAKRAPAGEAAIICPNT